MSPSVGEELEVGRVVDQLDAGRVGPEEEARDHEERDRGETDTPAEARQQPGGEQRRARATSVSRTLTVRAQRYAGS